MAYTPIDKSNDYFTPYLWTGNGAVSRVFTGVGLQADMMWSKIRTSAHQHNIVDTVRGVNQRLISPNLPNAEDTTCTHGHFDSLDPDGFTITGAGGNWNVNASGNNYVGWNWKAGGTAVSNTAGSITSSVSANTDSGFSVVTYTGNATTSQSVGHGLNSVPKMIIVKNRIDASDWKIYHASLGTGYQIILNSSAAASSAGTLWGSTTPTSNLFYINNDGSVNGSGDGMVAYCFADVKGYSKMGSYTGNGSTDGTFVYTGFKPAFVMTKSATQAYRWYMFDNKRNAYNVVNGRIFANTSDAEATNQNTLDFTSNGFKIRTGDAEINGSGQTIIYLAIAEQPFVTSGGTPTTAR